MYTGASVHAGPPPLYYLILPPLSEIPLHRDTAVKGTVTMQVGIYNTLPVPVEHLFSRTLAGYTVPVAKPTCA